MATRAVTRGVRTPSTARGGDGRLGSGSPERKSRPADEPTEAGRARGTVHFGAPPPLMTTGGMPRLESAAAAAKSTSACWRNARGEDLFARSRPVFAIGTTDESKFVRFHSTLSTEALTGTSRPSISGVFGSIGVLARGLGRRDSEVQSRLEHRASSERGARLQVGDGETVTRRSPVSSPSRRGRKSPLRCSITVRPPEPAPPAVHPESALTVASSPPPSPVPFTPTDGICTPSPRSHIGAFVEPHAAALKHPRRPSWEDWQAAAAAKHHGPPDPQHRAAPSARARDVPTGRPASRPRSASVPPHPTLPNRVPPFPRASPPSPALLPPRALPSPAVRRPAHRAARPVPSSAPGLSARRRHRRVARPGDRIGNGYRFLPTHGARGRDARVRQGRCTASVVARGAGRPRE